MKINSMIIIDINKEEAAFFEFSEGPNLIVSQDNTQGKSSVIKSLYYTLGYDIKTFPSNWDFENMYFCLECEFNGKIYTICRQKKIFKIKEEENRPMNHREFSDWLQDKLNINMQLPNKTTKELHRAYASAILLPFYIDQDSSWEGRLYIETAGDVKQYSDIPKTIMEYVLGISDIEIQSLTNKLNKLKKEMSETKYSIKGLERTIDEYQKSVEDIVVVSEIDKDDLKQEIEEYLALVNEYNDKITKSKIKILNKQKLLNDQKQELAELNQLLSINKMEYKKIKTTCAHCHSSLTAEQSLTRLELSNNKLQIEIYRDEVIASIQKLEDEISKLLDINNKLFNEVERIDKRIKKTKKLLTIDQYVDTKSKNLALKGLTDLLNNEKINQQTQEESKNELRELIKNKKQEKEDRKEKIFIKYNQLLNDIEKIISGIDTNELSCLDFRALTGSGIHRNKKYLVYYLVYFALLKEFGVYKVPICMDSFIKNEISKDSVKNMFRAIEDYFFTFNNQSFFSIIQENIVYLAKSNEYKIINIGDRVLSKEKYQDIMRQIGHLDV